MPLINMISFNNSWKVHILVISAIFFASCIVLPTPVLGQEDNLATKMLAISEDINRQLQDIMATQAVNFTSVNTTGLPYNASSKFYPKGMSQLYNATNMFMDMIQSKQAYPEGLITINNGILKFADPAKEWKIIVTHYGGLAGIAVASLFLAAILPFVGLFFCCCRCAGNCGARRKPFDKKHDHCRKVMLNMLLIGVATMILYGVVCAFATNELIQAGTESLPDHAKTSLKDVELYLTTTKRQINNLLKTNYDELEITLNNILQASGRIVTDELAKYSNAISLTNLNYIVNGLDTIRQDLRMMNNITQDLRANASQLDIVVRLVRNDLLNILNIKCKVDMCQRILHEYKINELSVQIEFDKLPDVTSALRNISVLMDGNIVSEVQKGQDSFIKIQSSIQQAVNQTIPIVSSSISKAGHSLSSSADNITLLIDRINRDIKRIYIPHLNMAEEQIEEYSVYRYYVGLGISGILLTILMCVTFGLFCGICGKRPDGYDDCCDKGSGARFIMMAVWFIFLLTSVLIVVTIAHMITGIVVQRGICEPLKNPRDNRMFKLADDFVQIHVNRLLYPRNAEANIDMSWILTKCHANETLYKVLKLEYLFDLDSLRNYVEQYSINSTINQLRERINLSPGIVILTEDATAKLNDLAQSGLSDIKFYQYAELLKDNITSINLEKLANKLKEVAYKLSDEEKDVRESLIKNAHDLGNYHRDLVTPMASLSQQLSASALKLEEHIKFNRSSMSEAIHSLIEDVMKAQQILNKDGPEYVQLLAVEFSNAFVHQVNEFLEHLIKTARETIGRCAPVSNAYNATIVAGCNRILDPFNGFWVSVGWCLIFFIPTIVLGVKLSTLYRISDPYPGPLVESEYLYDAYADRDNMPLAHVHDKKHSYRYQPHTYAEGYDGPTSALTSGRERTNDAHQGSSHHDSRYSDLASNFTQPWQRHDRVASSKSECPNKVYSIPLESQNWDFPNGGPPRYQPPAGAPPLSAEYERPPPYYYPGPGDRN